MSVLATSASGTEASKEAEVQGPKLQQVPCLHYLAQFSVFSIEVLIDSASEVNAMQSYFAKKLSHCICKTNVGVQKIDSSRLKTFEMVIASFQVNDKDGKSRIFKETFPLAHISMDVAHGMPFLTLSNIQVNFNNRELR